MSCTYRERALTFGAGAAAAFLLLRLLSKVDQSRRDAGWRKRAANDNLFVGVDLGGTTMSVGVVTDAGRVVAEDVVEVGDDKSFAGVSERMVLNVKAIVARAGSTLENIAAIGIGAPGMVDIKNGLIKKAANFDWIDAPLAATVQAATGRPTFLENDANAAVLAEWWVGAGAGADVKHMVMFTIGTGIGGGVVSDDRIIRGHTGLAGEFGHSILEPCVHESSAEGRLCGGTGVRGILEQYCSARAVASRAQEAVKAEPTSSLASLISLTAKDVFEHAGRGDALATKIVESTTDYLAVGLINACRAFDPQLIVITGGLALAGEALLEPLRRHFLKRWWTIQPADTVRIALAQCGNNAGFLGAAAAARCALYDTRLA